MLVHCHSMLLYYYMGEIPQNLCTLVSSMFWGINFFGFIMKIPVSRICKFMENDPINTICSKKLSFNEHFFCVWINSTTKPTKCNWYLQ